AAGVLALAEPDQFDPADVAHFGQAQLQPQPRIAEGQELLRRGVATAIDLSDGLAGDLQHICEQSRVSARIDLTRVPVDARVRATFGDQALNLALYGGEDYELLCTGAPEILRAAEQWALTPLRVI